MHCKVSFCKMIQPMKVDKVSQSFLKEKNTGHTVKDQG